MVLNKSKGSVRGYIFPRLISRVLKPPSRYLSREDQWPCFETDGDSGAKSWSDESESDSRFYPKDSDNTRALSRCNLGGGSGDPPGKSEEEIKLSDLESIDSDKWRGESEPDK